MMKRKGKKKNYRLIYTVVDTGSTATLRVENMWRFRLAEGKKEN